MKISFLNTNFLRRPNNYKVIDKYVSRSAQPKKEEFKWLKEQGVTDIFNFRTMYRPDVDFDEEEVAKSNGLKYHSIPSITMEPKEEKIDLFLKEIEEVKKSGGKAHIHCKAGADRTGMYAFIYKILNNVGTFTGNIKEWFKLGYHYKRYPDLMEWTIKFVINKNKI